MPLPDPNIITPESVALYYGSTVLPETFDYFSRAEALGGSFDLTSVDPTYTERYVKNAINDYIVGLKNDGLWDKLTEIYLLSGVTYDGIFAKLKHAGTPTLTNLNDNFVSADYKAAGEQAGLKGDGSSKALETSFSPKPFWSVSLASLGFYASDIGTENTAAVIISGPNGVDTSLLSELFTGGRQRLLSLGTGPRTSVSEGSGFLVSTRATPASIRTFHNGSFKQFTLTDNPEPEDINEEQIRLYKVQRGGTTFADSRITFAFCGIALTDTDAVNLSLHTNALMTALGTNVYDNE